MKQRWFPVLGGGVAVAILVAVFWPSSLEMPSEVPEIQEPAQSPTKPVELDANVPVLTPSIQGREARILEFASDPIPSMLDVRVGGAGLDADFHAKVAGNQVPIAMFFEGEELPTLEVRATSPEGCFWGDVSPEEQVLNLTRGFVLNLEVQAGFGLPLKSATLRLGREVVGFVFEHPVLSERGTATVECLPPGHYVLDVRSPGFLTSTQVVNIHQDTVLNVEMLRGQSAQGRIKSNAGEAIAGVTMVLESCSAPQTCVPHRLLTTGADGRFMVDDLPFGSVRIRARHPDFQATTFFADVSDRLELSMAKATERLIRVVDESGKPIPNAQIVWTDQSGEGESMLSDANGHWRVKGIPNGATIFGSYRGYQSPNVVVDSETITLTLKSSTSGSMLLRVNAPAAIVGVDVVRQEDRAKCTVTQVSERDFEIGCKEGQAVVRVQMEHGVYEELAPLSHGYTLQVPPPTPHRLTIQGSRFKSSLFVEVDFGLGFEPIHCPWVSDNQAQCSIRMWHGVRPRVRARDGASKAEAELKGTETTLELKTTKRHRLWVADAQGSPLTGAWIGVIDGQGRRLDSATSSGQLPFERVLEEGHDLRLYVVDPRRGDARIRLGLSDEQTLRLVSGVGESAQSPYLTRGQTEEALGVRLVSDGAGFRFDDVAGTSAAKAGVPRGAWWVAAWQESKGIRVVSWTNRGYQEYLVLQ